MEKIWLYAIIGGFAPIIFWLFFWMRSDFNQPEPRRLILKTLLFGSMAAFFAVWLESESSKFVEIGSSTQIFLFSFIEEFSKFSAVFLAALGSVWNNEREDPMIYMITGALGFAAIENMYYVINYIENLKYLESLIEGGYRFIGATLLHISASAIIGICISLVFFKKKSIRILMAFFGLILATIIHAIFNFLVSHQEILYQKFAFYGSWGLIIIILVAFELLGRKERYRIIRDGIIYSSYKKISWKKYPFITKIATKENLNLKIKESEINEENYSEYQNDSFRKKFF